MKLYFLLPACGFAMSLQAQHVQHGRTKIDTTAAYRLSEVRVTGKTGVTHIRQSGYNAMTIDTKSMQNTTKTLADALRAAPALSCARPVAWAVRPISCSTAWTPNM